VVSDFQEIRVCPHEPASALDWGSISGHTVATTGAVTWFDEGTPWAVFRVEEVIYHIDVQEYVRAKGA
jgi:hypothetical protein